VRPRRTYILVPLSPATGRPISAAAAAADTSGISDIKAFGKQSEDEEVSETMFLFLD